MMRDEIEEKIANYAKRLESFNNQNDGNTCIIILIMIKILIY